MELHGRNSEGNAPFRAERRCKPISEIVRNAAGKPIGRIARLRQRIEAYTYAGPQPIGRFDTERQAIRAIRARHEARR